MLDIRGRKLLFSARLLTATATSANLSDAGRVGES